MNSIRIQPLLAVALFLVITLTAVAQTVESEPDLTGQLQVQVIKTSLLDYATTKLVLGITLAITSKRDLTLEQIILDGLRINGLPVYVAPVKQRIQLHSGDKTLLPDPWIQLRRSKKL